jgi:hypothetical protein
LAFDDRQWLTTFTTTNGRDIVAIVHNEFQGDLRPRLCPSRDYFRCWENAITLAVSTDGGDSFHQPADHVIAALPYVYQGDVGRPIGYFQPGNIVSFRGFAYVAFTAQSFHEQRRGVCMARSATPAVGSSWRAWNGHAFAATLNDRGAIPEASASTHICAPVGEGSMFEMGSLTYDTVALRFVFLTQMPEENGNAEHPAGAYAATSNDLVHWDAPRFVLSLATLRAQAPPGLFDYQYLSLIDESSRSADFETIDADPSLYLYYVQTKVSEAPWSRQLMKIRVDPGRILGR